MTVTLQRLDEHALQHDNKKKGENTLTLVVWRALACIALHWSSTL